MRGAEQTTKNDRLFHKNWGHYATQRQIVCLTKLASSQIADCGESRRW